MTYNARVKKRNRRKKFRLLLISTIFLYLIFRSVPSLLANNARTILPEKHTLVDKTLAQAFIIKDESVIKATSNGDLEIFSDEGARLSAGTKVASISGIEDNSFLLEELDQIEESIRALEKSGLDPGSMIKDQEKIDEIQDSLTMELQESINKGEFEKIYSLKEELAVYNSKDKDLSKTDTLIGQSLENLKNRKEKISSEINNNRIDYYTNRGGIISYELDGYEEIYIPKDFENYDYDRLTLGSIKYKNKKNKSKSVVDEPIFKIIDNFQWYMCIKIDDLKEIEQYENRDMLRIQMKEDEEEIVGQIIAINNSKDKSVMVVKFDTRLHDYYMKRFPQVYLIKNKVEGFKIPKKAIVDQDSIKGLYVKDGSGIVRFRPVNIIEEEERDVYVEIGDNNSHISLPGEEETVKTISIYDEIFLNPNNIREGQILD